MIREMSIDSITRTSPDATDDLEEDFVEDDLEDDFDLLTGGVVDSLGLLKVVAWLEDEFDIAVDDSELEPESFRTITVKGGTTLSEVARQTGISMRVLRDYNPAILHDRVPPGPSYELRLPLEARADALDPAAALPPAPASPRAPPLAPLLALAPASAFSPSLAPLSPSHPCSPTTPTTSSPLPSDGPVFALPFLPSAPLRAAAVRHDDGPAEGTALAHAFSRMACTRTWPGTQARMRQ